MFKLSLLMRSTAIPVEYPHWDAAQGQSRELTRAFQVRTSRPQEDKHSPKVSPEANWQC